MSEEKDPIRYQIDEAARDRIIDGDLNDLSPFDAAVELATSQDKIATNRTVEAAIEVIDRDMKELLDVWNTRGAAILQSLKEELEKLRR